MNDLNEFLAKYLIFLKKVVEENNNKKFKFFERTFLDLVSRNKNNTNGVYVLLKEFESNDFIIVPIASIMRTITADGLTLAYLSTFFTDDLDEEQITITNEINSFYVEFLRVKKEFLEINKKEFILSEDEKYFFNHEKNKFKTKIELHKTSKKALIEGDYKLNSSSFLLEKSKFDRIKISNSELKVDIEFCYKANKYFSQYYHYSPIGGKLSRTKNSEILKLDVEQIKNAFIASFFILTNILEKLKFIKNEDVIELKNLADNLVRNKF